LPEYLRSTGEHDDDTDEAAMTEPVDQTPEKRKE
jgi:hypothetical protein